MALLLKIKLAAYQAGSASVPKQKSKRLTASDVGQIVFVWFADDGDSRSSLRSMCALEGFEEIDMPQVGHPERTKPGYRVTLRETHRPLIAPLTTDDLEPVRYSTGQTGINALGGLHRDRNDKIFDLNIEQEQALQSRFAAVGA
jgi:hypothetical protein